MYVLIKAIAAQLLYVCKCRSRVSDTFFYSCVMGLLVVLFEFSIEIRDQRWARTLMLRKKEGEAAEACSRGKKTSQG